MAHRKIDIYNELDNFVEENEGEVTHTEIARHFFELGRNNASDEACEWLEKNVCIVYNFSGDENTSTFMEDFREAMKGE